MANGFSDYVEGALFDTMCKGTAFPAAPANLYLALFSADPGDTGASNELTGNGYARVAIPKDTNNSTNTNWNAKGTSGQATTISNKATITFPTATGNWTTATYFALFDASTGTTNMWFSGVITGGVTVNNGNTLSLVDGNLVLTVD